MSARALGRWLAAWLAAWLPCLCACAQSFEQFAVDVGPGPFLAFRSRPPASSTQPFNMIVRPDAGVAVEWLRYRGLVTWHARLDLHRVLVGLHGPDRGLYLFDLVQGTHRRLGEDPVGHVGVRGGELLLHDGARLIARSWTDTGPARVIGAVEVSQAWLAGDEVVVVDRALERLRVVDLLRGTSRVLAELPERVERVIVRLSPDRRNIAVGALEEDLATISVLAIDDGRVRWGPEEVDMSQSLMAGRVAPRLCIDWLDARQFACSIHAGLFRETVVRDLATGEIVDESGVNPDLYDQLVARVTVPLRRLDQLTSSSRMRIGAFEVSGRRLYLVGDKEPFAVDDDLAAEGDILLLGDGRFAVERRVDRRHCLDLLDGDAHTRRRVFDGWATQFHWVEGAR